MIPPHRVTGGPETGPAGNPFRASQTRPGTLPFQFTAGESCGRLVQSFQDQGARGQIVGPHGSGKTTLMIQLVGELRSLGREVCHLRIDSERGWIRAHWRQVRQVPRGAVVAIDGWDQLPRHSRLALRWFAAWRGLGLLVTTHAVHRGLPVLWTTFMDESLARQVILAYLQRNDSKIAQESGPKLLADLPERLRLHQGNLREVLFDLYERARSE